MIKVYFDDVLIDTDSYTQLDNEYKLFTESFKLGSTASNVFYLSVDKSAVSSQPSEVRIEDDITTWGFIVDNITANDNVYTYVLVEKLMDFNFDYDASILINAKAELEEDCYLSDIWHDMCDKAGVEYDETYEFENDIVVTWYNSRIQARKYLSFIAELQSGYACMLENGKQSFKKQKRSSVKTIDADECSDLIIGEKKTITRVVYDGGAFKWEFGDDTGDTLYLQSDNVFIVNEDIVENIYNNIKDFEFYIIDVPQAPMDSTVKAGDVITFNDNGKLYPTIAQYSMSYAGSWSGGYKLQVNTERQQETQITRTSQQVRNIQTKVDRINNEFSVIAEEIEKLTDYIRNVGTTGDYLMLPDTPKSGGAINKLSIKGFTLKPKYKGMQYKSATSYKGVLNFYTLVFDTVDTFDNTPNYIYINSPIPLQKYNGVSDEILIEENKIKIIQRLNHTSLGLLPITPAIIYELDNVLLPTFDGDTYVKVLYFDNLQFDAEYIIKNDLTSNFATQLESSTQFLMNQKQVVLKVNNQGKVVAVELGSDGSTGSYFEVVSDNIRLEGLTTINGNFKVLEDGSIEAVNGKFSGDIYLSSGGKVIGGDGLLSNLQYQFYNAGWVMENEFSRLNFGYQNLGINGEILSPSGSTAWKNYIMSDIYIPDNFTVKEAIITLFHIPTYWDNGTAQSWGYCRNLRVYKVGNANSFENYGAYWSEPYKTANWNKNEIIGAFGSNGWTSPVTNAFVLSTVNSSNIASSLNIGNNKILIQTSDAVPTPTSTPDTAISRYGSQTGLVCANINIIGFINTQN